MFEARCTREKEMTGQNNCLRVSVRHKRWCADVGLCCCWIVLVCGKLMNHEYRFLQLMKRQLCNGLKAYVEDSSKQIENLNKL